MIHLSDPELVAHYVLTGDNQYFAQLYTRHWQRVYQKCLSYTGNAADSEDYVQDIFIRLTRRLKGYKGNATFTTWLHAVTTNYCIDKLRQQQQEQAFWSGYRYECCLADQMADRLEEEAAFLSMEQVLARLPVRQRDLLLIKYQKGERIEEIAFSQNIKPSAVKMRIKRARAMACSLYSKILREQSWL